MSLSTSVHFREGLCRTSKEAARAFLRTGLPVQAAEALSILLKANKRGCSQGKWIFTVPPAAAASASRHATCVWVRKMEKVPLVQTALPLKAPYATDRRLT